MRKLLIFHPYLAPYRIDLYNNLAKVFHLKVALFGQRKEINTLGYDLDYINSLAKFDFKYYERGFRIGRHLVSTVYLKLIKGFRPDIVLAHELGINTLFAIIFKRLFHYKIYVTVDDSPAMAKSYKPQREKLRSFIVKHVDGMIVVNPDVKRYLEEKYKNYNCRYLYFPIIQDDEVLLGKINDSKTEAEAYVERYGLQHKKVILFVGRLEAIKCPDVLIDAFEKSDNTDSVLVIVGTGSLNNKLREKVANSSISNKVIFTGKLTGQKLYAWYYIANIFVLPSKFEPFGAVVNEALVAGCFTVVTDRVGAASLVDAKNGIVIKANEERMLCEVLNTYSSCEKCHEDKMSKHFNEYFSELIKFINE